MINNLNAADLPRPAPRSSNPEIMASEIIERLTYRIGKDVKVAKPHDWLTATILVVRDRIIDKWMESTRKAYANNSKRVYYLSLEFLIGRLMRDAISNIGLMHEIRDALSSLGVDLDVIAGLEPDAALGNGGLGRLAACFMESMATVDIPAYGYGIRYVHGLFRQQMADGWQVELPETWLAHGNPWEFERRESSYEVGFGGSVETIGGYEDPQRFVWKPAERVIAMAYDTPVVGWRGTRVNTLRLWSAQPIDPILLAAFNAGDHIGALRESNKAESLTRVLYPADATPAGQELRLDALADAEAGDLFLIFRDATSGKSTYGSGRYLHVPLPDAQGRVPLDFNFAYNPPCAFTGFATCQLPPRQNWLPVALPVGEKQYAGGH